MNRWTGSGTIKTVPRVTYTQTGKCRVAFLLDVPRNRGGTGQETDYIACLAWGGEAEDIRDFATAGARIEVDGRLQTSSWGEPKRYKTEVIVEAVGFLDRRPAVTVGDVHDGHPKKQKEEVANDN